MNSENAVSIQKPWLFQPGQSGNPAGKPKGARHFSTLFREAIKKIDATTGDSTDVAIVKAVLNKAKKGDLNAVDIVREEVDGLLAKATEQGSGNIYNITVVNFDEYNHTQQLQSREN